ncbi:hypothetical protein [Terrabacter sp. Root181]|uniref:hypothetical protein n=1 Tax=Terrabacter sp. Root181 TaxID=1736484 RepID=UPI0006F77F79|nr:hypothetical protein [Terrabacter sp. Root181]KRB44945.1 hypothetical protein ASD90_14690 [Terrabacter sp. Root181]
MTPNDGPGAAPADPDQRDQRDQSEPTNETGSTRPGDPPPPGSVAAEAALLVELLSRRSWSSTSGMPSGSSRGERAGSAAHDHDADAGHTTGDPTGPGTAGRPDGPAGECTCGGTTPAACRVCPVCQLIAFVQQVNPDTIEKVADFVGFAATALRDLATAQRERRTETDTTGTDTTGTDTTGTDTSETQTDETGPGGSA